MELREFITTTLTEIAQGVADAKPFYANFEGKINPPSGHEKSISKIEFEVTLADNSANTANKGIGVLFGAVSLGGSTTDKQLRESYTKIKFSIVVTLP